MKLIVGLGNPGQEYSTNRHNIGFLCINYIAKTHRIELDKKQGKARVGTGSIAGNPVVLAKPQTYMNLSGESVVPLMQRYLVKKEDLIVIHDDLDLPLGKIRIRPDSSAGGHNGIKSIIGVLGAQDFIRIRVGISRPQNESDAKPETIRDYVLGDFSEADKPIIEETIKRVGNAVVTLITSGLNPAMNKFNTEPKPKKEKKETAAITDPPSGQGNDRFSNFAQSLDPGAKRQWQGVSQQEGKQDEISAPSTNQPECKDTELAAD